MPNHKATPTNDDEFACKYCQVPLKRVPGGQGPVWVHADGYVVGKDDRNTPPEFWSWDTIPEPWKREVDGEREVVGFTFTGIPAWLPWMGQS